MADQRGTLELSNDSDHDLLVVLEPWGDEWRVAPGDSLTLAYEAPDAGELGVTYGPGRITVYGWTGSTISRLDED